MMTNDKLASKYRKVYEQAFIPIFARDDYQTDILLEGCAMANFTTIEYTLRREDSCQVIPTLRGRFPELILFVGSTMDSDKLVLKMSERFRQLMTIPQLKECQVDGFISMLGWSTERIREYCRSHLLLCSASTITEALRQMDAGAHFIKFMGNNLDLVRQCRAEAAFDFCPVFITGGMSLKNIPTAMQAGVVLLGSGCEVVLSGVSPKDLTPNIVCERMLQYQQTVREARAATFPCLANLEGLNDEEWFARLPHYHPFSFSLAL